jgi:hypothetical protein
MGKKKPGKKDKKEQKKAARTKDKGKKAKRTKPKKTQPPQVSHEQRLEMIRTAAYYLAEKRAFHSEGELEDWLRAEQEIEGRFPSRD